MIPNPGKATDDPIAFMTADLLGLADVRRWGVIKTSRTQSVAEHSFCTAAIVIELGNRLNIDHGLLSLAIYWALIHDLPETLTGDIDGKFKRDNPDLRASLKQAEGDSFPHYARAQFVISDNILALVKLADKVESIMFIRKWGIGGRAEAVAIELEAMLPDLCKPVATAYQGPGSDDTLAIVTGIIARDRYETHTIQSRPVLAPAPVPVKAVGVEDSDNGGMSAR